MTSTRAANVVAIFVLLACVRGAAQEPLRVEVAGDLHQQMKPIVVRISNLSDKAVQLALPMYEPKHGDRTLGSEPLEVERKDGKRWAQAPLAMTGTKPRSSPLVQPHESTEFKFGIHGAGEYRLRVWYLVSPGDVGPPARPPRYASVLSQTFRVE